MMCDLLIANENTKFGQPEINLGVFPAVEDPTITKSYWQI